MQFNQKWKKTNVNVSVKSNECAKKILGGIL